MPSQDVLPECQQGFLDLQYAVKTLQQDGVRNEKVIEKLSEAVEKIEEMNANLCKMIALHELKHDTIEKTLDAMDTDLHALSLRSMPIVAPVSPAAENEDLKQLLKVINRWRYILTGAAFVIGYLLAHINWGLLISLLTN